MTKKIIPFPAHTMVRNPPQWDGTTWAGEPVAPSFRVGDKVLVTRTGQKGIVIDGMPGVFDSLWRYVVLIEEGKRIVTLGRGLRRIE